MSEEKNPYKEGSARYKMWERREAERKAAEEPTEPVPEDKDDSKRREYLDKMIEGQTTDSNQ